MPTKPMEPISQFEGAQLEAIAQVLADTSTGLTGSEIGRLLAECRIPDPNPTLTKWKRLYNAFVVEQNQRQYGNHVIGFIHKAMKPARWLGRDSEFTRKQQELNGALAFAGLQLRDDGTIGNAERARTLKDAASRASILKGKLELRQVHEDVIRFCRAELLEQNYFHAVLEASKSVAEKIRALSGLTTDGAELATQAFALGKSTKPLLAITGLGTETERSEQKGFVNLLVGLFGTFRNPSAHAPKIYWPISEQDALDILSLLSLVHRKIDRAHRT